ncbi:MAG: hypothetical protein IMF14_09290 [Proteobacteria bacterium]|nr:hypothetical protein [Pseudomonadota bacterium]
MSLKQISTGFTAVVLAAATMTSQADAPNQPANAYWQAPNWSAYNGQPQSRPQGYARPVYRQPYPQQPSQMRQANPYDGQQNMNRGNIPPPPAGPYASRYNQPPNTSASAPARPPVRQVPPAPRSGYYGPRPNYGPDRGASAYNMPGYNQYRRPSRNNNSWGGNRWNSNKFWGRSGPSTWMNPSKDNWENSWDDMINSPSRMGEMPGGWNAPEVTMPNPVDMGDQMQDNVQDLPDQMKNMDVGDDVN